MWLSTAVGTTILPGSKLKKARLATVGLFYVWNKVKMQLKGKRHQVKVKE